MFTMVRSNLKKTQEFYHGTRVCAGSPKGVRIRCTPHKVYRLEQQQQQKSKMGWLFFTRYVTFYENVNV
jgi:hypothetical protein